MHSFLLFFYPPIPRTYYYGVYLIWYDFSIIFINLYHRTTTKFISPIDKKVKISYNMLSYILISFNEIICA